MSAQSLFAGTKAQAEEETVSAPTSAGAEPPSLLAEWLTHNREPIHEDMHKSLMGMIYANRSFMRLSTIKQLAFAEIDQVIRFFVTGDEQAVTALGSKRAKEGLGSGVLLTALHSIQKYANLHLANDLLLNASERLNTYTRLYLESYIETRETVILNEQEHIRSALQSSFNRYYVWLQTAAEVSRSATSTLDLRQLITEFVDLVRAHYDHHHVALYLVDNARRYAVLRASSGREGSEIGREGQKVRLDETSLVGWCIVNGEARTIANTQGESLKHDTTLLPESRSIMLLPLTSRRRVIGAISIQSVLASAFYDDDVTRMQTVADQLANAIENARLYHELQLHSQDLAQAVELRTLELQKTTERVEAILNNSPDAILLLNPDLLVELCNPASISMFGYSREAISKRSLRDLIMPATIPLLQKLLDECAKQDQVRGFGVAALREDGSSFSAGIALATIREHDQITGYVCIVRDITEQVEAEEQIKGSLREKEVLLQEIHHRVKNNMQVISSLIALQAGYTDDDRVHQMFRESQSRIRSMALVHELLYRSRDLARIDFAKYIRELTANLMRSYPNSQGRIQLEVNAESLFLDIDTAIPCGLIINELVSNAFKHAFPNSRGGRIQVEFGASGPNQRTLIVRDDGVGFPQNLNVYKTETLGLQLVTSLTAQLNATIGMHQSAGTSFEIRFAVSESEPPIHEEILRGKTRPLEGS
jgi:PAS domain S-box-containing protein